MDSVDNIGGRLDGELSGFADFVLPLQYTDENDTPTDITGWSLSAKLFNADGTTAATFTVDIIDAEAGQYQLTLSKSAIQALTLNTTYQLSHTETTVVKDELMYGDWVRTR
jgi:hypothetical protein